MTFQPVKGTEDWYAEKKAIQRDIFNVLRKASINFGFQEVEAPALETMPCLTQKSGDEVRSQIFTLDKRSTEELGLRFDLTVPMTRMFIAKQKAVPKPVKWFSIDKVWRYEAPQKGRAREFYQLSVELFGSDRPEADADVICLAIDCLNKFDLTESDIVVKINNRKLLEGLLLQAGVAKNKLEDVTRAIDKKSKVEDNDFIKLLLETGLNQEQADNVKKIVSIKAKPKEALEEIRKLAPGRDAIVGLAELENVLNVMPSNYLEVDLSLARGLAYYTGTVFEVFDKTGQFRAIAGGGRYDNLVELMGGEPCPAVGFGLGDKTLWLLLESKGKLPQPNIGPDYYIVTVTPDLTDEAVKLSAKLSRRTSCDLDLMGRKFGKQLEYANAIGAKNVIILGPKELAEKKVKIKNMQTGEERLVELASLS
ncbi:histidine--tRNA ligase [Candidatus Woesearchaeota archaeon]|nr:histidine--tRNA ligase [Candidatus Woesearchaeota archaeon]